MKGLELSKKYYNAFGEELLSAFPELRGKLAAGLCGAGSQCLGFDDGISADHDYGPGFCIFISRGAATEKEMFALERAYASLPESFCGFSRSGGEGIYGIKITEEFLAEKTGSEDAALSIYQWLSLPEQSLLEATCGEIWYDGPGTISKARSRLSYFPEDIRLKKLAGEIVIMGQAGLYNFSRCVSRGDTAAAQLSAYEFARAAVHAAFLAGRKYMPYYKWRFKALRGLDRLPCEGFAENMEYLISTPCSGENAKRKIEIIRRTALAYSGGEKDIDSWALEINSRIKDNEIRNMHILAGVTHE